MLFITSTNKHKILDKDIKTCSEDLKLVGGRDKVLAVKIDNTNNANNTNILNTNYIYIPIDTHINTICKYNDNIYYYGCQNGNVYEFNINKITNSNTNNTDIYTGTFIYSHSNNVCSMYIHNNILYTGSWDNTLIKYNILTNIYNIMYTHPLPVWGISVYGNILSSGCADGTIRMFNINDDTYNDNNVINISYHNYPIRSIIYYSDILYTVDNEGYIYKYSINTNNINNTNICNIRYVCNMIYTMYIIHINNIPYIIVGGENGNIFILDSNLIIHKVYKIIDSNINITIWKIYGNNANDNTNNIILYICCSNGCIYTININNTSNIHNTNNIYNDNNKIEIINYNNTNTISNTNNTNSDIPNDQIFTNNGITYKIENGKVYEQIKDNTNNSDDNNKWKLIGSTNNSNTKDNTNNMCNINVELNGKYYVLSFNINDNYYDVAQSFLHHHKLPLSYTDEIVSFININVSDKEYKEYDTINIEGIKKVIYRDIINNIIKHNTDNNIKYITDNIEWFINQLTNISSITNNTNSSNDINKIEYISNIIKIYLPYVYYDICKYMIYKDIYYDINYILDYSNIDNIINSSNINNINSSKNYKNTKAWLMAITNLLKHLPIKLYVIDDIVYRLKDRGLLKSDDMDLYEYNRNIILKKKNK